MRREETQAGMSGRRRAKPNRGGGRFNKPRTACAAFGRGGGGRGRDRGGGRVLPKSLQSHRTRPRRGDDNNGGGGGGRDRERARSEVPQLPMQRINMTSENQERVKVLLRELQTQDFEEPSGESGSDFEEEEEEYDELDYREDGQFWETRDDPVERAENPVMEADSEEARRTPEPVVSLFAVGKLCRYGFDRERGRRALEAGTGELGATLERLLQQVFSERYGAGVVAPEGLQSIPMDECLAQRQEEVLALTAIYGERFTERISNYVWTVSLDLQFLAQKGRDRAPPKQGQAQLRDVCRFYLKGAGCRFGDKCKFKHQLPSQPPDAGGPSQPHICSYSPPEYELEVRFPKGNRYPFQAPLVAFGTNDEKLGPAGRLHVTEHLYGEALAAARSGEPVVYTLITCLEDESKMKELLAASHHKYSSPPPLTTTSIPQPRSWPAKITTSGLEPNGSDMVNRRQTEVREAVDLREQLEEEEDEEEEDNEEEAKEIAVETESYVNLRKKVVKRYEGRTENLQKDDARLCREFRSKRQRQKLPAWQERENILDLLKEHQVLVVSGMTGCGKTTQIPQFILDATLQGPRGLVANIVCTQPRRISAISVAQRVAQERAERLGHSVGYQIRLESVKSSATRLLYCTTGVLLRRLEGEPDLRGITHVIVDEVHERTEESDFLILVLKDLIAQRPDLKIVLMSATLNAELFSQYFYDCQMVHIPGRTFPVDQFFLEDAVAMTGYVMEDGSPYARSGKQGTQPSRRTRGADLVDELGDDMWSFMSFQKKDFVKDSIPDQQLTLQELTVRYKDTKKSVLKTISAMDLDKINMDLVESLLEWIVDGDHDYPPGAVLVFMPGLAEIKMLYEQLQSNRMFNNRNNKRCAVYPLHSSLSNEEQQAVFNRPPEGVTKIIISTNIAETSVTIDDVVYVVDSGRMKEKRYDASRGMESLDDSWVSRANALQRKGRAGRVASGICFHLFTSHCFRHHLAEQQLPEIQRVPLEQLCLRIKVLDVFAERPLESVFSRLIEPPAPGSLNAAKQRLQDLGALTAEERLTPLGYHLACLPVDVRIGKLMLFGAIFRCLDPALTIAASLAFKSPFVSPWDKREEANVKKLSFAVANSDHLALLQAYKGWCAAAKNGNQAGFQYCRENFLSGRGLQEMASLKRQFAELLSDIGFVKEGLRARVIERTCSKGMDGILEATGSEANLNSDNIKLISAMLCAALYPNVIQVRAPQGKYKLTSKGAMKMQPKAEELRFVTKGDGYVHIHPSSVNYTVRHYDSPYLVYHEKVKTSRVFIRDCSMVSVYPLVLFGGGQVNVELLRGEFVISLDDGWIRFAAASHQVAELVKELRWELDQLLEDKIRNPSMDLSDCPRGSRIISMIVNLISTQ
ncbi:putative ATP-dependent RNA helicase DHX57 [Scleropages formosus]|uniref:Putative ATP-dependent RNA helicase DHX57 n=1 Tax=Scleropages formosus TaxID=113540 RepID=A0A0P7XSY3_SCLFO|nr:putative ATP-dependent RNA helicase DHX57 [Scleropages formosus]